MGYGIWVPKKTPKVPEVWGPAPHGVNLDLQEEMRASRLISSPLSLIYELLKSKISL